MKRYLCLVFGLALLLVLSACQREEEKPWVPLFEDTGYGYLEDATRQALAELDAARAQAGEPQSLERTEQQLLALQLYFLPLTQVRQLIYDADRLAFNGDQEPSRAKLEQAHAILLKVAEADGEPVSSAINELLAMLEDVQRTLQENPAAAPARFRELGHKVNLMLTRGDLVLAGARLHRS